MNLELILKFRVYLTIAIGICLCSCSNELPMVTDIETAEISQTDDCLIDSSGYKSHMVEFHTNFPYYFRISPATFETTINQILVKDSGTTESIYVQDSVRVRLKDSYNTSRVIPCIDSLYTASHETVTIRNMNI